MISRRRFIAGPLTLLAAPQAAEAQQAGRVARIGFIGDSPGGPFIQAVEQELHKLGYIVGENIAIVDRSPEGNDERLPRLAAELVRLKVDVLVVALTQGALAGKSATTTIPVVMVNVADPGPKRGRSYPTGRTWPILGVARRATSRPTAAAGGSGDWSSG
jgi:putative ABC transport system substrate-binding protein